MGATHGAQIYQYGGVPVVTGDRIFTGNAFFVHSVSGSDSHNGKKPSRALATLDKALAKCTNDNDDVIYVMAGHAETITGAGGITLDKSGVSIIGLGHYDARPAFLMDGADTVTMLVTAANVRMKNILFRAGHEDIAVFCTISAKGFWLDQCQWEENVATENWVVGISAGVADNDYDGLRITDCIYTSVDAANKHAICLNKNSKDVLIAGNRITGQFAVTPFAPIYSPSTEIHKDIWVFLNTIHNLHNADAAVGISIANTASTGAIVRNLVGHQDAAAETPILAGAAGLFVAENYCSGVLGTASGYLYPTVDS